METNPNDFIFRHTYNKKRHTYNKGKKIKEQMIKMILIDIIILFFF
jgi:hypothetical protein